MILHNFNFFKYNSEKLDLRERYRDVNTTELTNITGFANDSVDCIKKILTMPEITSETDPSVEQEQEQEQKQLKSDEESVDSQVREQPEPHTKTVQLERKEIDEAKESDDESGNSSETEQTETNESDGKSGDSSETVTKDQQNSSECTNYGQ